MNRLSFTRLAAMLCMAVGLSGCYATGYGGNVRVGAPLIYDHHYDRPTFFLGHPFGYAYPKKKHYKYRGHGKAHGYGHGHNRGGGHGVHGHGGRKHHDGHARNGDKRQKIAKGHSGRKKAVRGRGGDHDRHDKSEKRDRDAARHNDDGRRDKARRGEGERRQGHEKRQRRLAQSNERRRDNANASER